MPLALYMDHHVPHAITMGLRLRGLDVLTAYEDGRIEQQDAALLDRAAELGRVLFTRDDDCWPKRRSAKERESPFLALFTPTNCALRSDAACRTWRSLPQPERPKI